MRKKVEGVREMRARRKGRELDVLLNKIDTAVANGVATAREGERQRRRAFAQNPGVMPIEQAPEVARVPA